MIVSVDRWGRTRALKPYHLRVLDKCLLGDGCWLYAGAIEHNGYGAIMVDGRKKRKAHRVVYEALVGPIPAGLDLDHLCRARNCVRPAHMEPVTRSQNLRRGIGVGKHGRTH